MQEPPIPPDAAMATGAASLPLSADVAHDLSMLGLFMQADPIVKGVMLLLALASVLCWAIILDKVIRVAGLRREAHRLEMIARTEPSRSVEARPGSLAHSILSTARREWADAPDASESRAEYRERLERSMHAVLAESLRRIEPGLPFLATVGSAAPFIGLFGTVWGIMSSFTAIARSNDTSLAVVAPGIAEALFATAIGLVAAIPAVIAYNKLITAIGRASQRLHAAVGVIGGRLSRQPPVSMTESSGMPTDEEAAPIWR